VIGDTQGLTDIARALARLHAYTFYVLRTTFKALFDDGLENWKALLVITAAMNFAAMIGVSALSIALGYEIVPTEHFKMVWVSMGFALAFVNYYSLIERARWSRFEREFREHARAARVAGFVVVWVGVTLVCMFGPSVAIIAARLPAR
jgi:hypothetical protein